MADDQAEPVRVRQARRRRGFEPARRKGGGDAHVRLPSCRRVMKLAPRHRLRLYSRPHIDLQRVAGALCCS
ncbi:putative leader peptide [Streptomyces sp. NPDC002577]